MLRTEPLLNYRFSLTVTPFMSDTDCGFMEVSGFSSKLNGDKYKEGGTNTYDIFLPTGIEWGNLVAKRGVVFMPIEIRELVIRATVDQKKSNDNIVNVEEHMNKIKLEIMNDLSYKMKSLIKEFIYKR